ncbi:hypothetical protein AYL99_07081 [Fonsecaea erecta]|uniref:Uncharacterized protein n=1 Tax=Fonsecaea erecta TaxID=1367422 RepID=A0A178ZES2_9EURO|nr:hypothetical protein AYL99_07081 [Fonsecaea erecta]OAP57991.1 hypothetical protein AYL99_07081 [Fonsecaea erecta]
MASSGDLQPDEVEDECGLDSDLYNYDIAFTHKTKEELRQLFGKVKKMTSLVSDEARARVGSRPRILHIYFSYTWLTGLPTAGTIALREIDR